MIIATHLTGIDGEKNRIRYVLENADAQHWDVFQDTSDMEVWIRNHPIKDGLEEWAVWTEIAAAQSDDQAVEAVVVSPGKFSWNHTAL